MFLDVRGLRSGYQQGTVLMGVDLQLDRGQSLGLLGRNGVGKSTLVMTLMGLIRPSAGSVRLNGIELTSLRPHEVARLGVAVVPQGRRIWPPLTVQEHLDLAERGVRKFRGAQRWTQQAVRELLPRLAERHHQQAGQLSGGEQQMLAIARALLTQPSLILLDEPSEGLAPLIIDQIGAVLKEVASEGVTVLLVEQDLRLAFSVAQEIAVMDRGVIVHRIDTAAFRRDPATANRLLGVDGASARASTGSDAAGEQPGPPALAPRLHQASS